MTAALVSFGASAALVALFNVEGVRRWRALPGAHWTERAAALYPVRFSAMIYLWLCPIAASLCLCLTGRYRLIPEAALAAYLGGVAGTYPLGRQIMPWLKPARWLHLVG